MGKRRAFYFIDYKKSNDGTRAKLFDGNYIITKFGKFIGHNKTFVSKNFGHQVMFTHNRRQYFFGKVMLQIFSDEEPQRYFHYVDGDKKNNHIDNLRWGKAFLSKAMPEYTTYRRIKYKHTSFRGIYVSPEGKILSMINRLPKIKKQRLLEGIPSITYKSSIKNVNTTLYTHLLVAEAYLDQHYASSVILWKDGNRKNCDVTNLIPATHN